MSAHRRYQVTGDSWLEVQFDVLINFHCSCFVLAIQMKLYWTVVSYLCRSIRLNLIIVFLSYSADCPVHAESLTRVSSSKQSADWRNNEELRFSNNPTATKGFSSAVFAPSARYAHYRAPNCFNSNEYQVAHVRREKKASQYGLLAPAPTRRAIVIQKCDDAPDPFCILTRER